MTLLPHVGQALVVSANRDQLDVIDFDSDSPTFGLSISANCRTCSPGKAQWSACAVVLNLRRLPPNLLLVRSTPRPCSAMASWSQVWRPQSHLRPLLGNECPLQRTKGSRRITVLAREARKT